MTPPDVMFTVFNSFVVTYGFFCQFFFFVPPTNQYSSGMQFPDASSVLPLNTVTVIPSCLYLDGIESISSLVSNGIENKSTRLFPSYTKDAEIAVVSIPLPSSLSKSLPVIYAFVFYVYYFIFLKMLRRKFCFHVCHSHNNLVF